MRDIFGPDGPLARGIPGFRPREVQARMAEEVSAALEHSELRLIEAGTGTGKTFAYLVPVLMAGCRVIVSTGTKNLQDQLFERDLPRLLEVLRVPARTAMLKGRNNYLCLYRMKSAQQSSAGAADTRLSDVERWSRMTDRGEVTELGHVIEDARFRSNITSTADNCLGSKCSDFQDCFVVKSRRQAMGADLVVANHHVLLSDVLLKEEGFGEILPGADAVIVDEAHQLPELAGQFFGTRVSTRQLRDLADDALKLSAEQGDVPDLHKVALGMANPVIRLESSLAALAGRMECERFLERHQGSEPVDAVRNALDDLIQELEACRERSVALDALAGRANLVYSRLALCTMAGEDQDHVRWVEPQGRGGSFHATPLDLGQGFSRVFSAHPGAWVLTSATLSAAGDFAHFRRNIGAEHAPALALESPFDYRAQMRLLLPDKLPEPSAPDYSQKVAELSAELIQASGGGAFVLCTSHRALRLIADVLRARLSMPVLVQGEEDRSRLVERFAADGNAVLVGTHSFWEGVDVKGRALRLVIIDKLPFSAPGDPVNDARQNALRRQGGNPFVDVQLPEAIVSLRQGAGRLIRDEADQGLLVLCDPRLRSKGYGKKMLGALPEMTRLDKPQALQWLAEL